MRSALRALQNRNVLRWLALLESADLLLGIFLGFIALYFVDVVDGLIPWGLGLVAQRFGLPWAMALLALGPISLLVGLRNLRQNSPHLGAGLSKNRLNL